MVEITLLYIPEEGVLILIKGKRLKRLWRKEEDIIE